ncbi:MAG: diacylglycerol/lipid kinase family protein [Ardenticatenaceae bacterium]
MKATLIFNPVAGQREVRAQLRQVVGYLTEHGWMIEWKETTPDIGATHLTREAVAQGSSMVIAAGGDGTINGVVNGLVGHPNVRLGTLPTGTANVWARESGIANTPLLAPDLQAAARVLVNGVTLTIDVGKAGDRYFLLMAGVGFDALVTAHTDRNLKKRVGPWAYAWTASKEALKYRGARMRITIDGETIERNAWMVTVSNSKLYALLPLAPDASLTDGLLDVGIFAGRSWPVILRQTASIVLGRHTSEPEVEFLRGKEIRIESDPPLPVQVDGDAVAEPVMNFSVVPKALRIVVPKKMVSSINNA